MRILKLVAILVTIIIGSQLFACTPSNAPTNESSSSVATDDTKTPESYSDFDTPEDIVMAALEAWQENDQTLFKRYFYLSFDADAPWGRLAACDFDLDSVTMTSGKAEDVGPDMYFVDVTAGGQEIGRFLILDRQPEKHVGKAYINCSE
ncbi:MAG: hypothetical protein IPM39_14955 [Chloroflexi bacterium]|nr:hypothetical protein [Chloroflexota bacterium]